MTRIWRNSLKSIYRFFAPPKVLSDDMELKFRLKLFERTRKIAELLGALSTFVLIAYIGLDYMNDAVVERINDARIELAVFIFLGVMINRFVAERFLLIYWFCFASILLLLLCVFFAVFALSFGGLNEAGPMLVMLFISSVTFFNLQQKIALWLLFLCGMFVANSIIEVDLLWAISNSILTAALLLFTQNNMDRLLRIQFKTELLEAEKAITDQLTGIYNRRGFEKKVRQLLANLQPGEHVALALLDIDYFKQYNDHYGHLQGDHVLVQLGQLLSDMEVELVVRFGGEEFIVVEKYYEAQPKVVTNICRHIEQASIRHGFSGVSDMITVSVGISSTSEELGKETLPELLERADIRLYEAKQKGRNQFVNPV